MLIAKLQSGGKLNFLIFMALSFSSCAEHRADCRIRIAGNKVQLYDPSGELSTEHQCNFQPTSAYWSEGPNGGWVIVCENGSPQSGVYFENVGVGVLPFIPYSKQEESKRVKRREIEEEAYEERKS